LQCGECAHAAGPTAYASRDDSAVTDGDWWPLVRVALAPVPGLELVPGQLHRHAHQSDHLQPDAQRLDGVARPAEAAGRVALETQG
jgi:hypothetical protein